MSNPLSPLGKRGTKRPPPLPKERKSDPFAKPEPPTRPNSPAHQAARLVAAWAKLPPARKRLVQELIHELSEESQ